MNTREPYRLYFPPIRQERYYGQLLSWTMDEKPRRSLMAKDIYAADAKAGNAPYQILETKKYSEPFAADGFENMAGKGKLCKAAGLTGAEKRACKKNIKSTCGRKPLLGKAKKEAWSKCASGAVVTPEQSAQELAEKLVPSQEEGLGTGAKMMIGVAVVGTLALIGFAVASKMKRKPAPMQAPVARPMMR